MGTFCCFISIQKNEDLHVLYLNGSLLFTTLLIIETLPEMIMKTSYLVNYIAFYTSITNSIYIAEKDIGI